MKALKNNIINQTTNGKIFKCDSCDKTHIEYKNLSFAFNEDELQYFKKYLRNFDAKKWQQQNKNSLFTRKIIIPIGHKNFTTLFSLSEFQEFKTLLMSKNKELLSFIKFIEINNTLLFN